MNKQEILETLLNAPFDQPVFIYDCESGDRIPVCTVWVSMNGTIQVDSCSQSKVLDTAELVEELNDITAEGEVYWNDLPVTLVDLSVMDAIDLNVN